MAEHRSLKTGLFELVVQPSYCCHSQQFNLFDVMRQHLPPLNAIKAFEAAARHLSFKAAAEELRVTPQAISQQIKVLEKWLQTSVFVRHNRSIELAAAGAAFLPVVTQALDTLETSAAGLMRRSQPEFLTINAPPTFAIRWLIPRLGRFHTDLPDLDYRLTTSIDLPNLHTGAIDVAIHWKDAESDSTLRSELLMESDVVPVCSPSLIGAQQIRNPTDLQSFTLIQHMLLPDLWSIWLQATGGRHVDGQSGPQYENNLLMIEAAAQGHGICLVGREEVARDLESGRLVIPIEMAFPRAFQFYLIYPRARENDEHIAAFHAWIFKQLASDHSVVPAAV
jgi:LysR family glycine cleavage system transcriptional activator